MVLPLLGICALFGRFWGKSWEPVQGLLTDGCGCGEPRCCGNLFILCLFLLWQVRQRFRGPKNLAAKKKSSELSMLKAVPPWHHLAIPVPSPGLSICPCTQKRLEIHVQKLVHRQKWGPPQKLRESWAQYLLSQLSGHTGLEKLGEPGVCSPLFPSSCRCLEEYHKELYVLGGWQFARGFYDIQAHLLCKVPLPQVLEGPGWMEQARETTSIILPAPIPISKEIPLPDSPPAPEGTPCHSLLPIERPCTPVDQLVEVPEAQELELEREDQRLARDEGTPSIQALGVGEGLVVGEDILEAGSQTNSSGRESLTYKDTSFPWSLALEDVDSEVSEQELEAAEKSPDTTPRILPLVQMWEGLQAPAREESLQDSHKDFSGRGHRVGGGISLMPGQHQHQCGQAGGTALELSHHDIPSPGWSEESWALNPLPLFTTPADDSNHPPTPSDTYFKEVTSTHAVPPKRSTLKKSSRLLLEPLMRRKITHLKWGLPRRIQESEWLFQLMGHSSPSNAGMQYSSPEEETIKGESKMQEGEPILGETVTQSSCQDPSFPKAASSAPDPGLQLFFQFKERLKCQEKEAQKLPMSPRKKKGKNDPDCPDVRGLSISLDGAKGPKQSPNLWEPQDPCDEALSQAVLPFITDCPRGGATREQTGSSPKDSLSTGACECRGSQETAEETSPGSWGSGSEPRSGPSNAAQGVFEKLGSPSPRASMKAWLNDPCKKEMNPKVSQDSQALPWAMVCHWSMPSTSQSQNMSDSGGDTPQGHRSEVHLLPAEQRKKIFWSPGGRTPESGASSYPSGRTKGPFRTVAMRLGTAFMNKMPWSPRHASSATSVSNHGQHQEDPDFLSGSGSSGIPQAGLPGRSWDREEGEGSDPRGFTRDCTSLHLERDSSPPDQSFCDDGPGESSAQSLPREQVAAKPSWVKRLRGLLIRLNFNK
ncbi:uncharacterized protein LOC110205848 [Phascolarctos cinereus]|uniref:Uncharacterized protein C22orf46 homolog n=1 Tax=Phascolarctos cinereus TaxID=38626 RepID=A0A6P5K091_PHACI|nr:uncharacterized protein C22orf46 homolog [Phascolarctos cinereus]